MITAEVSTDDQMRNTIREVWQQYGYMLEPHGATGYRSLVRNTGPGTTGVFLETAHPSKFRETVEEATGEQVSIPLRLAEHLDKEKKSIRISGDYKNFKDYLIDLPSS